MGPPIALFWTSGDVCHGFKSQGGFPHLWASSPAHNRFFRTTTLIFLDGHFDGLMSVQPILPIKVSVTTETMLNFEGDFDGHGDVDITCKQTLMNRLQNKGIVDSFL